MIFAEVVGSMWGVPLLLLQTAWTQWEVNMKQETSDIHTQWFLTCYASSCFFMTALLEQEASWTVLAPTFLRGRCFKCLFWKRKSLKDRWQLRVSFTFQWCEAHAAPTATCQTSQLALPKHAAGLAVLLAAHVYVFLCLWWIDESINCLVSNPLFLLACLHAAPYQTQTEMKVMEKQHTSRWLFFTLKTLFQCLSCLYFLS